MNAFQIKCYLFPENTRVLAEKIGEANEIRRFALVNTPYGIYNQLLDKIQAAYSDLLPIRDEIKVYWLDEENELVGFSTDAEMQYAIDLQTAIRVSKPYDTKNGLSSSSVFKVYIVKKPLHKAGENNSAEPALHPGVVCDGCNNGIYGIRYKCTVCRDYDLCSECEGKGIHKEHSFVKITRPGGKCPYSGRAKFGPFGKRCPRGGPCGSGSQQSFQETMNNFMPFITNNVPLVNDPDQLKSFGEFMKQFLDPFGIDVDYYVTKKDENKEKKEEAAAAKASGEEKKQTDNEKDLLTGSKIEEKMQTETSSAPLEPSKSNDENVLHRSESLASNNPSASASNTEQYMSPFEMAANALKSKLEENSQSSNKKPDEEYNGFNLVDIEKELKYINSIEQLKMMGYNDDGGWLTRLVIAKDGNINSVLDSLNPSK